MTRSYPKESREIALTCTRHDVTNGIRMNKDVFSVRLQSKLAEYLEKIGGDSPHLFGIIVKLLTHGKVRVDFRYYTERLELEDQNDKISRQQAIELFDDYLTAQDKDEDGFNRTHRIIVQKNGDE